MSEANQPTVQVDVIGLPEFQHLLNMMKTIVLTTTDERTKSFILAEVEARELVPKDALNTFEILADLPADLGLTKEQQVCTMRATISLAESMACIDDARQLSASGSHLSVVLGVLHDFMDGLTSKQIASWEDAN